MLKRSRYRTRTRSRYLGGGGGVAFTQELSTYRAAREDVATSPVDIVIFGNSITGGALSLGQSGPYGGFPTMLGNLLTTEYGPNTNHGPGWVPCRLDGVDPIWELTNTSGNSAQNITYGAGRWGVDLKSGDVLTLPATVGFEADQFIVCYTQASGKATLKFDVDDVEDFTQATANATTISHRMVSSGTYTDTTHKLEITAVGGDIIVDGVFLCRGNHDAGFRVWNCGHSGDSSQDVLDNPLGAIGIMGALMPAVIWWQHFFNDRHVSVPYADNLAALAAAKDAFSPTSSLVFSTEYETAIWTIEGRHEEMVADTVTQAGLAGCAWIDLGHWLRDDENSGSFGFNGVSDDPCFFIRHDEAHPEKVGNEAIADIMFAFLSDNPLTVQCAEASTPVPSGPFQADPIKAVWASDPDWSHPDDGDPVQTWANRGSVAGDPTTGADTTRPLYRESVTELNGEAGVDFDGVNDKLYNSLPGSVSHPFCAVAVIVPRTTVDYNGAVLGFLSGATSRRLGLSATGTGLWQLYLITGGTPVIDTPYLLRAEVNDAQTKLFINEVEVLTGSVATALAPIYFGLGAYFDGASTYSLFYDGIIAFAALYDKSLIGDADWATDVEYLKVLYDLPIADP